MSHQETIAKLSAPPQLDTRRHALFLDLDGTLVEFAAHPEQVIASEDLRLLLTNLTRAMHGAVALVTGRSIASADAVLDGVLVHVAGVHGFERRSGERIDHAAGDVAPIAVAANEARLMAENGALRADIEQKSAALALHFRRTPDAADSVRRAAGELAHRHGLSVLEGNMVVELKLSERTKGDAINDFMRAPPFAGRTPIAVGDDVTDEDAFRIVRQVGGFGILVGAARPTAAAYTLTDTTAVQHWLEQGLRP